MTTNSASLICCDAHVHIYDCFEIDGFLDSAWNNFHELASQQGSEGRFSGVLLLSEARQDNWFSVLADASTARKPLGTRWTFHETEERESLLARNPGGSELVIVAGRQLITRENLEVLALAIPGERPDGEPIADTIDWVRQAGGIPVVPWGFGKWWGKRGEILSNLLDSCPADRFFLGDNSGRPRILGKPYHFTIAEHGSRRILPGSDPLPFQSETGRAGSVGLFFKGELDSGHPARLIRSHLDNPDARISTYMRYERLLPFARKQVAMQIRKRLS